MIKQYLAVAYNLVMHIIKDYLNSSEANNVQQFRNYSVLILLNKIINRGNMWNRKKIQIYT